METPPGPVMSIHVGRPGLRWTLRLLRDEPDPTRVPGLRYGRTGTVAEFDPGPGPSRPHPSWVGLFAVWDTDADVDRFVRGAPGAARFEWHVRLDPLRVAGSWPSLADVEPRAGVLGADDPVSVVTLGEIHPSRFVQFVAASVPAERAAGSAAVRPPVGITRGPALVMSYSQWPSVRAMTAYAHPRDGGPHADAMSARERTPFHRQDGFVRCRTYHEQGTQPTTL